MTAKKSFFGFLLFAATALILQSCRNRQMVWVGNKGDRKYFNIPYGSHPRQVMDVYLPKNTDAAKPKVVLVHGGAWVIGRKEHLGNVQRFLHRNGFETMSLNYRLLRLKDTLTYNSQQEDLAAAISAFQDFNKKENIANSPLILLGESAGGQLALLYGYRHPEVVSGLISLSGPTDFYSDNFRKSRYYGRSHRFFQLVVGKSYAGETQKYFEEASPLSVVSSVPTLHFQGDRDFLVNVEQGKALDSALTSKNVPHRFVLMKGRGHAPRLLHFRYRDTVIYPEILSFLQGFSK